jgi:hypothetical protein
MGGMGSLYAALALLGRISGSMTRKWRNQDWSQRSFKKPEGQGFQRKSGHSTRVSGFYGRILLTSGYEQAIICL